MRLVSFNLLLAVLVATPCLADVNSEATAIIGTMMDTMGQDDELVLEGERIMAPDALALIYADSDNAPIWTNTATVKKLLEDIEDMADDGFDPAEFHQSELAALGSTLPDDPGELARRDLLLTDSYFTMLYTLSFGNADPHRLDKDWNLSSLYDEMDMKDEATQKEVAAIIHSAIVDDDLESLLNRSRPQLPLYHNLREGYQFYRGLAAAGGWSVIPEGATLREGDTDPQVSLMRQRLILTSDFTGTDTGGNEFDADMAAAVTHFQARHGLTADGIAGKKTYAAMNVPVEDRVNQIRANLERARWVMQYDVGDDLILVNVAAYQAWLVRGHKPVWNTRVQVGKPYTRTPIFSGSMKYLEFNPTWTVPASISNTSTLASLKKNPDYLATKNMVLLDSKGNKVDPSTVDWPSLKHMPYTVRQEPGPNNALGRVKFIFPNAHAVYLHDTPSRSKFSLADRAFSHGCIRTENPLDLATLLLDDQPKWTRQYIDTVIESAKRTRVNLTKPLPVLLIYWTAYSLEKGTVNFRNDLYERDGRVLKELSGPIQEQARHRM